MIIPDFAMFAASYISDTPHPVSSALIKQEAWDNAYITGKNDKLFRQLSLLRARVEETATTEQFKQNKHNFDVIFEQIDVENMNWLSFFGAFDFFRNFTFVQSASTYCYEQKASKCIFEKETLRSTLSFYNTKNLNSGADIQIVASYIGVKAAVQKDEDLQEPVRLKKGEAEQTTKVDSLPLSSEELEDAFAHKESSSRDAFATEDISSSAKQLE
ncbi:TrwN protein [Bartonella krasnovii]|uniref:TrwN protein n=1 Tax=Bartonella krasnovii TaxID=2267275 RepID=A0ABY3VUE3_9HYPH|nr:TrwN protein [Bartonella krasnovii]UNF28998.1 TrwN protein [Bartonella krasnovii]UNF35353.1 TrwN protein [Bartonella krasnovii]UNF36982.1 TrwN protein [Bartonella krasnovii]UNF48540.1 TrwN protein [Bartonella krasnovii]